MGDSDELFTGDGIINLTLYHGGRLKWEPRTEYIGGRVTLYYFESEGELTYDNLRARTKAIGHSGLFCMYYRNPSKDLENGLVLMRCQTDIEDMIGLARTNNNNIDVYVKHCDETSLDSFEDHNLFQRIEGDGSNDVGECSDELDDYNFDDSDYSMTDDDMLFANNVDEGVEWVGRIREDLGLGKEVGDESEGERHESDCDDLESLPDNDLEEEFDALKRRQSFPLFKDSDNIKWTVGTIFTDHYQCREAIMKHSYTEGRVVKFVKSDRTRVRAVCKDPCPWFIYAGLNFDKCIQIKTVGPDHTCVREQRGLPLINSGFLARKYLPEFRINPTWPIKSFHKTVLKDLQIDFPAHILRKARRKCMKTINGTHEEQYEKLWDYKTELLKRNPNSTVEIDIEPGNVGQFRRIYICLGGLKHGFKLGCRKVIGLDGCHIKTVYKGQLLCAVGIDPNNCMFPLAYAVVEAERLETWRWFLALLVQDFDIRSGDGWTFISDRKKGLLNVVEEMIPMAEQRYCVRHMHNNFKQKYGGRSLKEKLWSCARASNVESFQNAMNIVKEENVGAWQWLTNVPFHHWTRSHFKTDTKCDLLLNNMCESFNRCILWARDQGILVMLEMIREYMMNRLQSKREELKGWDDRKFTPKIYKLLDKFKKWSGGCYSSYAGYDEFEVTTVNGSKFAVHIGNRTCGCRRWDLTGIPCHHAISCLNRLGYNVEDYVDELYSANAYKKAYSGIIYPMNGHKHWTKSGLVLKPPTVQKQPGRPKKRRRAEPIEAQVIIHDGVTKLSRTTQMTVRCGKCKKAGHNKRTCPDLNPEASSSAHPRIQAPDEDNVNEHEEEEMQAAYNELVVEFDGPPVTQPSQVVEERTTAENMVHEPFVDEEAPIEIAARKIRELRGHRVLTTTLDSPIMMAAERIKEMKKRMKIDAAKVKEKEVAGLLKEQVNNLKMKKKVDEVKHSKKTQPLKYQVEAQKLKLQKEAQIFKLQQEAQILDDLVPQKVAEEERRKVIKAEMSSKIEAHKTSRAARASSPPDVRRSNRLYIKTTFGRFKNTSDTPVCLDEDDGDTMMADGPNSGELHNTYTGPMKMGKQMPPPVKQFKTIIGKTKLKSASFLSHGKNVITSGALRAAIEVTSNNLRNDAKAKQSGKGKDKDT